MNKLQHTACAILAGGKNSRMKGRNKALLKLGDTTIIETITKTLEEIFDEIIIVTNTPNEFVLEKDKYILTADIIKNIGPLGGIHSALLTTSKESVFIVPCDMPYLNLDLIKKEIIIFKQIDCDVIVPRIDNYLEPIHSIYKKKIVTKLETYLESSNNYYIRDFLNTINVHYMDLEENLLYKKIFTNINTPEDLNAVVKKCYE